jgi:hypothetical protein
MKIPEVPFACAPRTLGVLLLLAAGILPAQSLLQFNGRVVAANGQAVPGVPGAIYGGSGTFDLPVIDENGTVLFRGRFTGGGSSALDDRAYFFGTSAIDLGLLIRGSDPAPGLPAGFTLSTATLQGLGGSPRLSADGQILFSSAISGPGLTTANDSGLFSGNALAPTLLVQEGNAAPGTAGATFSSSFSNLSHQPTGINRAGRVLFQSSLAGGDVVGTTNNSGWFTGDPILGLELVQRRGDTVFGGEVVSALGFVSQMNDSGQVALDGTLSTTLGTPPATVADDKALWIWTPGVGLQPVVREGDPAPGTIGAVFGNPTNSWSVNVGANAFNNSGLVAMNAQLLGGDAGPGFNDYAVYIAGTAGLGMVMRRGDQAPGLPVGITMDVVNNSSLRLNNGGDVAFQCTLAGGVSATDDSAIYAGAFGTLALAVREGDAAPGTLGATFGQLTGLSMHYNDRGQVLFHADLIGGDVVSGVNNIALYAFDPELGLQLVMRRGEQVEVAPGVFETVASFGGTQFSNGDAAALCFNRNGEMAMRVNFMTNGAAAIVVVKIGSLVGLPGQISVSTGGIHSLFVNAGSARANEAYILAGTVSGTSPGFALGGFTVPLNIDDYFNFVIFNPNTFPMVNNVGTLDSDGRAVVFATVPALPFLSGITFHHAFVSVGSGSVVTLASEPAQLILTN